MKEVGGPGYTIPHEISNKHTHIRGAVAGGSSGKSCKPRKKIEWFSVFHVSVQNYNGTPHLDGEYTVFGQVVKGMTFVDIIANQPKNSRDKPLKDVTMTITIDTLKRSKITELTGYSYEK